MFPQDFIGPDGRISNLKLTFVANDGQEIVLDHVERGEVTSVSQFGESTWQLLPNHRESLFGGLLHKSKKYRKREFNMQSYIKKHPSPSILTIKVSLDDK